MSKPDTPNFGFKRPTRGSKDWDVPLNENLDKIDTVLGEQELLITTLEAGGNPTADFVKRQTILSGKVNRYGQADFLIKRFSDDLCRQGRGRAIANGCANIYTHSPSNAFNGTTSPEWGSLEKGSAVNGVSWIGYDFGEGNEKHVQAFRLSQHNTAGNRVNSVKLQRSDDGVAWADVITVAVGQLGTYEVPASQASRYWRLLANSDTASGYSWAIYSLEFYEVNSVPSLGVGLLASSIPLRISFAEGFNSAGKVEHISEISEDVLDAWPSLTPSATNYLYVDRDASSGALSYGSTIYQPNYDTPELKKITHLVFEVFDHYGSNCATITELRIYDSKGNDLAYSVSSTDAYDSARNGIPYYWNNTSNWGKDRLRNGNYSYTNNSTGGSSSTIFLYSGNDSPPEYGAGTGHWARFTVTLPANSDLGLIKIWAGSPENRIPYHIKAYVVEDTYDFNTHVKTRTEEGLIKVGEINFDGTETTVRAYDLTVSPLYQLNQHWFDRNTMTMKVWDGMEWRVKQRVFIGEATADATQITEVKSYALNGAYESEWLLIFPNTSIVKNHNIGVSYPQITSAVSVQGDRFTEPVDIRTSVLSTTTTYGIVLSGWENSTAFNIKAYAKPYHKGGPNPVTQGKTYVKIKLERPW